MTTESAVLSLDEFRAIWVYSLDVSQDEWGALLDDTDDPATGEIRRPLANALGLTSLDSDFIDFLVNDELKALPLSQLLIEAHGMDAESVAPDAAKLDALRGQVVLVHSSALAATAPSVEPRPPLKFVGRYREALKMDAKKMAPAKSVIPPPNADPAPPAKKKPSDAAMSGRVATIALLVMALLVWVMIRIAG